MRLTLDQEVLGSIPREAANSGSWSEKLREPSPYLFRIHVQKRPLGIFYKWNYDAKQPEMTQIEATIQVASIDTDNDKRDSHLKSVGPMPAEFWAMRLRSV